MTHPSPTLRSSDLKRHIDTGHHHPPGRKHQQEDDGEMAGMGNRPADILRAKRGDLARIARQHPPADDSDEEDLEQRLAKLRKALDASGLCEQPPFEMKIQAVEVGD